MSTRIYNGFKFKSKNIKEILSQLKSIREDSMEICDHQITEDMISRYVEYNKICDLSNMDIFRKIKEEETYTRSSFPIRYNFSVVIFPDSDGDIYGAHFAAFYQYEKLLDPFIDDFAYWDSTDRPDELSEEEWTARSDKWDELIPSGVFSEDGFTFGVVRSDDLDNTNIRQKIKIVLDKLKRQDKIDHFLNDGDGL